jgi:hypothetical protein
MNLNNKQTKFLTRIFYLLGLFVVVFSFYKIFIKNDYEVVKQISCDPKNESCFVSDCESNDSSCDSTTTYMKIKVISKYAGSDYNSLSCENNSPNCKIITCNDDVVEAGEKCFK